jgi:hypothetical protein
MLAARLALLIAAAGLTDGLLVRPALRQQHALVAASAQRSVPGGATMGLLPSFLTDAQGKVDAQRVKSAARVHDYFNIVATSVMSGMVIAARFKGGAVWDLRLAFVMGGYLLLDSFFIGLLPEIVAADGDGASGGVATLLAHHFAAIGVSWHAATWAPHTMYTSYMAVVEINTLFLMLKSHVPGKRVKAALDKIFLATWLSLRLVWLPPLLVWLVLPGQVYPSLFRHIFCAACASWLVALQFLWTWNFLVDPTKRVNLC